MSRIWHSDWYAVRARRRRMLLPPRAANRAGVVGHRRLEADALLRLWRRGEA